MHQSHLNENNLLILTDFMDSVDTVSVSITVNTGSRHEHLSKNGISHCLEHMAFKGTKTRSAKQIAEEFEMIGAKFNAYTSKEKTVYYAKVLKDDVHTALDILSDILQNSVFDPEELKKERKVILEELKNTLDTPENIVWDKFQETAFPNQPLGRTIIGTEETILGITREDLIEYTNQRYGYDNVIVSAAGNLDHTSFVEAVNERLNNLPQKSTEVEVTHNYVGGEIRFQKDLKQAHLLLGFPSVSYAHDDSYKYRIAASILGGGMSSRLFQEVREKKGLAYHIASYTGMYLDNGVFTIYSANHPSKVEEVIKIVAREMIKLTKDVTEEELQKSKAQLKVSIAMSQESSVSRAEKLAFNYSVFGRFITVDEIYKKIDAVTVQDVQNVMVNMLSKFKPTFAVVGDVNQVPMFDQIKTAFEL